VAGERLTVTGGDGSARLNVYVLLPMHPNLLVAVTVNVLLGEVGVPESTPVADNVIPDGNEPPVWLKVYGAVPPEAVSVCGL